jgi:uncharacterized membrane protein
MNIPLLYIILGMVVMFIYYLSDNQLEQTFTNVCLLVLLWPFCIVFDSVRMLYLRTKQIIKYWRGL